MNFFYVLLLGIAVSLDGLMAGVAYGLREIRVPKSSFFIVGLVTTIASAAALAIAVLLGQYINTALAIITGSILLILLGFWSIFQQYLTRRLSSNQVNTDLEAGKLSFSIDRLVINIMAKPETADLDRLGVISSVEAVFLGLAVGADAAVGTFAAALTGPLPLYTPLVIGLIHVICIWLGFKISNQFISNKWKRRFPFLPGIMLMLLGLIRLF